MSEFLQLPPMTREDLERLQESAALRAKPPYCEDAFHALALKLRDALEGEAQAPAARRERAVNELLEIAKLADDDTMQGELEALASRFSYPPRPLPGSGAELRRRATPPAPTDLREEGR